MCLYVNKWVGGHLLIQRPLEAVSYSTVAVTSHTLLHYELQRFDSSNDQSNDFIEREAVRSHQYRDLLRSCTILRNSLSIPWMDSKVLLKKKIKIIIALCIWGAGGSVSLNVGTFLSFFLLFKNIIYSTYCWSVQGSAGLSALTNGLS